MDFKKLQKYRGRKAVSPVVATLILIIVAIVGAVAVGLIVSGIGTQTGKNANVSGAGDGSRSSLIVGGSTTLFPAVVAGATAFSASTGEAVNVTQGGSGAGMTGVALGVLDIGDASSFSAVSSAISQFPSADLQAVEVGGSGVVFIANGLTCNTITLAALQKIYTQGTFTTATCTNGVLNAAGVGAAGVGFTAVSRSDLPSGTEDTACSYLNTGASVCASSSNNAVALPGVTAAGNPGVLSYVETHANTVGFVDLGFAEGAATTPGSTTAQVNIVELNSTDATVTPPVDCVTGAKAQDCYALKGESTANLHAFIQKGLSQAAGSVGSPTYPDISSGTSTGLTRTFWMVTKGPADTAAQQFLTFMQSPANVAFWNNAGYFSIYQISPITPP